MRRIEDVILKDGRNLKEVLELHKKWLEDEEGGKRADLSYEDLSDTDLSNLNLRYAILRGINLSDANLIGANLRGVSLRGANLTGAKLTDANLNCANLIGANLTNANLIGVNLIGADLTNVYLTDANLIGANLTRAHLTGVSLTNVYLTGVNLTNANLRKADLTNVNLREADLTRANLSEADLTDADLIGANLIRANLIDANLTGVKYDHTTSFFTLQCQEEGSFIGYKKADNKIVKLLITEDAKRSSATTRKCRCSKAKVLSITSLDGKEEYTKVASNYDADFIYEVGKIVEVEDFDENRWKECAPGIHFFITRNEAVMY